MEQAKNPNVPDHEYRAILTDREKEILAGHADVTEKYRYRVITRVRQKIKRLNDDLAVLDEHHDTLGDELRDIACKDIEKHLEELDTEDEA